MKNFEITQKFYHLDKNFMSYIFFLNTFGVTLQYLFYVYILFYTIFYLKRNFNLKIDPKMCTFKNLEEILKTLKKRVGTLYVL